MNKRSMKASLPKVAFSVGGHRSLTILIVSLILFISICVYFVNVVVLIPGDDASYRTTAENNAQLTNFNTSLLKQAQDFSANANNTELPAGRTDPFTP